MSESPEQGITREKALELASEAERPILELLLRSGPIKTNRGCLLASREIALLSRAPAVSTPQGADEESELDGKVVYLTPDGPKVQWVECPFCGLGTRAQVLKDQGVMTGWGECEHYYSASTDSAEKPGLFFISLSRGRSSYE